MSVSRLQAALRREAKSAALDVQRALEALARTHARRITGTGVLVTSSTEVHALSAALARLGAASELSGRVELRFPTAKPIEPEQFASYGPVPIVAFDEAILDLEERDPIGAAELRRAGLEVEDAYGGFREPSTGSVYYPHSFAAAKAADEDVARRVRDTVIAGLAKGKPTDEVVRELVSDWEWPVSYAANVSRTTINTATTAGRLREGARVAAAGIPVGFEFQAVMDSNTRPGHAALHGLKMRGDDPLLDEWSPPLSWQCRCVLIPLIGSDVPTEWAHLPAGAAKDQGFGRNPAKASRLP